MPSFAFAQNADHPIDGPARLRVCDSFVCRLRGLMFRSSLHRDDGLLMQMGRESRVDSSIHMFFVPFAISVIWVNSTMEVVDKTLAQPWHPAYFPARPARYVLEMHPGRLDQYEVGNKVRFNYE